MDYLAKGPCQSTIQRAAITIPTERNHLRKRPRLFWILRHTIQTAPCPNQRLWVNF